MERFACPRACATGANAQNESGCVKILRSGSRARRMGSRPLRTPVALAENGVSRRPKDGARQNINALSVSYRPCSLPVSLARSRSISFSPSPDKSETKVVGKAKNAHRVHQTEPIRRQYCIKRIFPKLQACCFTVYSDNKKPFFILFYFIFFIRIIHLILFYWYIT